MARKTEVVVITDEGRDRGNAYLITEMPASQAESWANRVLLALARGGLTVPADLAPGWAGLVTVGTSMFRGMRTEDAQPLLDEMFACIRRLPSGPDRLDIQRPLIEDDIEEVWTRWHLRDRVVALHMGFSIADKISTFLRFLSATGPGPTSSTTSTSNGQSQPSSPPGSPPSTNSTPSTESPIYTDFSKLSPSTATIKQ